MNSPSLADPAQTTKAFRPKARIGCIGTLVLGLLFVAAFEALFNPWAYHMGGRFTLLTWTGVGTLEGANGARDALYVRLSLAPRGHVSYSPYSRGPSTFTGDALLGTPQGAVQKFRLSGSLHNAWLNAEGAPLTLGFRTPYGEKPREAFNLRGAFHGTQLVLEDRGTSGHLFQPDGSLDAVRGQYFSTADKPYMHVTLDYGGRSDFDALERRIGVSRP